MHLWISSILSRNSPYQRENEISLSYSIHSQEIEQMKRSNQSKEEEMQHRHALEKKRLPKILKQESKTRSLMFKQSLRLSIAGNPEDERSKLKQVGRCD